VTDQGPRLTYREMADGPIGTVTFMDESGMAAIVWDAALAEAIRALPEITAMLWHVENNLRTYQDDIRRVMDNVGLRSEFGEILDVGMQDVLDDAELRRSEIRALLEKLGVKE